MDTLFVAGSTLIIAESRREAVSAGTIPILCDDEAFIDEPVKTLKKKTEV
jgi:hypothetical protein